MIQSSGQQSSSDCDIDVNAIAFSFHQQINGGQRFQLCESSISHSDSKFFSNNARCSLSDTPYRSMLVLRQIGQSYLLGKKL